MTFINLNNIDVEEIDFLRLETFLKNEVLNKKNYSFKEKTPFSKENFEKFLSVKENAKRFIKDLSLERFNFYNYSRFFLDHPERDFNSVLEFNDYRWVKIEDEDIVLEEGVLMENAASVKTMASLMLHNYNLYYLKDEEGNTLVNVALSKSINEDDSISCDDDDDDDDFDHNYYVKEQMGMPDIIALEKRNEALGSEFKFYIDSLLDFLNMDLKDDIYYKEDKFEDILSLDDKTKWKEVSNIKKIQENMIKLNRVDLSNRKLTVEINAFNKCYFLYNNEGEILTSVFIPRNKEHQLYLNSINIEIDSKYKNNVEKLFEKLNLTEDVEDIINFRSYN